MLKLLKKDLMLFLKDQRSVILTFLLPVILITLFAFAYGSLGSYNGRSEPVRLLVADLDQTDLSRQIINKTDSHEDIITIPADSAAARELIRKGKYAGALVIYKGFQDSVRNGNQVPVEMIYDRSREMETGILRQNIFSALMSSTGQIKVKTSIENFMRKQFPDLDNNLTADIIEKAVKTDENNQDIKWTSVVGEKNDTKLGLIQAVAGTAIMMLLFSVAGVGTSILEEKENGTINRLLYSPVRGSSILYGKMLFAFLISVAQLATMFIFAWLALNMDMRVSIPGLVLMVLATSLAVSGLGIFLASVARTRQQAQNLSTIIILVMSAIGGSMIPLFIMPVFLQKIAVLSVNYWGIQGFYDLFWRGLTLSDILPKILVLVGFGVLLSSVSVVLFRRRILKM